MSRLKRNASAVLLLSCLACPAQADELPDMPKPKVIVAPKPDHSRRNWLLETATLGALYAADFTITARGLGTPYSNGFCCHTESDPLYGRHPSNTKIALISAAQFAGSSLLLHKTERSKHAWIRWGGRALFAYSVADEIRSIQSWK